MKSLKPKEAAEQIGISYPTIKQWTYEGKIKSFKTPGGHHRISEDEVRRLTGGAVSSAQIINLLKRIEEIGLEFMKLETLCTFDGELCYSLGQEQ